MEEESRVNLQVVLEAQQAGQREEEGDEGAGGHEDGGGVNGGGAPARDFYLSFSPCFLTQLKIRYFHKNN